VIPIVLIILVGVGALTLLRYDVQRLNWNWFDWFVLDAILFGHRGEHL
jgi:hypothetical protein